MVMYFVVHGCSPTSAYLYTGADPYCIVTVGKQKAVTPVQKNTLDPNFNSKVMFFVSSPGGAEVTVEVCIYSCDNYCTCISKCIYEISLPSHNGYTHWY